MKHAEFRIDSYKIEYFNSLFGNEKIKVDGTKVSNKFSVFGTTQTFDLNSDNFTLSSSYELFGKQEIKLELKKNGVLIEKINVDLNPKQRISWVALAIIFGIILYNSK